MAATRPATDNDSSADAATPTGGVAVVDSASGDSSTGDTSRVGFGELEARLRAHRLPAERIESIRAAFETAERAHEGQFRRSGDPYICHPLETALILTDIEMLDAPTLQAALLHDVVEDSPMTLDEMVGLFGAEVAGLVDGVTKLSRLAAQPQQGAGGEAAAQPSHASVFQAESLRKMLVAMAQDVRVVLIKLADRLHNMRTLDALLPEQRNRISLETRDIFAPLAHRLGIDSIESELNDLSFTHLEPARHRRVANLVEARLTERETGVREALRVLTETLAAQGYKNIEISGRTKSVYSIAQKMERYREMGREFEDINDLQAVRVVVKDVQDCYGVLGIVHGMWRPLPGQFDDYIANPRESGYQSLHTTVVTPDGDPLEVQIRTVEMHETAEYGIAAHWRYKEGAGGGQFDDRIAWLRQLLDWQRDVIGAQEFVDQLKREILVDQVYVYTPRGEIRELPAGSTPLDFAFRIHTDLGYGTAGSKVNGRMVSLSYTLKNGDTIEIISSKQPKGPSLDWLNPDLGYVRTELARSKIRHWFRVQERSESTTRGRQLLERETRRLGVPLDPQHLATLFGYQTADEFILALGTGQVGVNQIAGRLAPPKEEADTIPVRQSSGELSVNVQGLGATPARSAPCCRPMPGEEIVGFITRNRGVTVHRQDCANIRNEDEPERLMDVSWPDFEQKFPSSVVISSMDRVGLLRDITTLVSADHINITGVRDRHNADSTVTITLTVEASGLPQISRMVSRLEDLPGVINVYRTSTHSPRGGRGSGQQNGGTARAAQGGKPQSSKERKG